MSNLRRAVTAAMLSFLLSLAPPARAQGRTGMAEPPRPVARLSPWQDGTPRPFAGGYIDGGVLFVRPALELGYGQPHWQWAGVEGYAITTNSFFATYGGVRATLPFLDATLGVRDTWSYVRSFLPRRPTFDARDVDAREGPRARYTAVDFELDGVVPVPAGYVLWDVIATHVLDVPSNLDVFEETLRVVARPPFVVDFRGGYVVALGKNDEVKAGVLSETLLVAGRDATVVRVGPAGMVTLTSHTDALFVFTAVVHSPDSLGLWDGPYAFAGVRYRWATGERAPQFP